MTKKNNVRKMWTKDEMRKVVHLWTKKTSEELMADLKITKNQLTFIVGAIRKEYPQLLPKKHKLSIIRGLIKETFKDSRLVTGKK